MTHYAAGDRVSHHLKNQEDDLRFGLVLSVVADPLWITPNASRLEIRWDDGRTGHALYTSNLFLRKVYDHDLKEIQ